jgi:DNA-binding response OmpR family regulator
MKQRILVIDDDEAMRKMIRQRLKDQCEIVDTGDATEALALALEYKPHCILLDLGLPRFSGLELCQTFCSLSHTRHIPIFVITGRSAAEHSESCLNLGASQFFQKPIDFARLRNCLESLPSEEEKEHRTDIRVQLKVLLKLTGTDVRGKDFELLTTTDEVSVDGFSCRCVLSLEEAALIEVFQLGCPEERYVGVARLMHTEWRDLPWQSCGFQFVEKTGDWILNEEKTGAWII